MNHFAAFNIRFNDAIALLPDKQMKLEFVTALIAGLSIHIDDATAMKCMERALDDAQGFNQPRLQLVQGGKR